MSPNAVRSCASVRRKSARARSSWVTTMMRGTPAAAETAQAARVPPVTPSTALTVTTATSATESAPSTAPTKSGCPGVSMSVTSRSVPSSRHVNHAGASPRLAPRAISSGSWSSVVVPCSTLPIRGIAPAR